MKNYSELQRNKHSVGQNSYHLIWSPKFRRHVLKPTAINRACEGVLRMIALQNGFEIYEIKVMSDHIHLFVELPPTISVCKALQLFKGISSRVMRRNFKWLRGQYPDGHMWSPGKFFRSVGSVTARVIEHYIKHSNNNYKYFQNVEGG